MLLVYCAKGLRIVIRERFGVVCVLVSLANSIEWSHAIAAQVIRPKTFFEQKYFRRTLH